MKSKVKITIAIITVIIMCFTFLFLLNQNEKLVTAPLNTLIIKLSDLPDNYEECINSSSTIGDMSFIFSFIQPSESYYVIFNSNCSNTTTEILCCSAKFSSSNIAKNFFNDLREYYTHAFIIKNTTDVLGDEFIIAYEIVEGGNRTHISFRILNVIFMINSFNNETLAYDLSEIVEQRTHDSLR